MALGHARFFHHPVDAKSAPLLDRILARSNARAMSKRLGHRTSHSLAAAGRLLIPSWRATVAQGEQLAGAPLEAAGMPASA
jgi:hypothetical protein